MSNSVKSSSLRSWCASNGIVALSDTVRQGDVAPVVFATTAKGDTHVLVLSKNQGAITPAGTSVRMLRGCSVVEGANAQGESRLYLGSGSELTVEELFG
jgi:hypothetical protein